MKHMRIRKVVAVLGLVTAASSLLFGGQNAWAATPDSCFIIVPGGTIVAYQDYENGDSNQPACPRNVDIPEEVSSQTVTTIGGGAFFGKGITAVTIPSSVTKIQSSAFMNNLLTSVVIPNSVTEIWAQAFYNNKLASVALSSNLSSLQPLAFSHNQLTSVTLPSSLTSLGYAAFEYNRITSVVVPDSITSVAGNAFQYQNPLGGDFPASPTPTDLDTVWLARLYTANPSNPNNLSDDVNFTSGGILINPAQVTVGYQQQGGGSLGAPITMTGQGLSSYLASENTAQDLGLYYRVGDTAILTAPSFAGLTLQSPSSPYNFVLAALNGNNSLVFRYAGESSGAVIPGAPDAGVSPRLSVPVMLIVATLVAASIAILALLYRYRW